MQPSVYIDLGGKWLEHNASCVPPGAHTVWYHSPGTGRGGLTAVPWPWETFALYLHPCEAEADRRLRRDTRRMRRAVVLEGMNKRKLRKLQAGCFNCI